MCCTTIEPSLPPPLPSLLPIPYSLPFDSLLVWKGVFKFSHIIIRVLGQKPQPKRHEGLDWPPSSRSLWQRWLMVKSKERRINQCPVGWETGDGIQGLQVCIWSIGFLGSSRGRFGERELRCIIRQSGPKCSLDSHWALVLRRGLKLLFKGSSWLLGDDYSCLSMQPHYHGTWPHTGDKVGCWEWSALYNSAVSGIQNGDRLSHDWRTLGIYGQCGMHPSKKRTVISLEEKGSRLSITSFECLTV